PLRSAVCQCKRAQRSTPTPRQNPERRTQHATWVTESSGKHSDRPEEKEQQPPGHDCLWPWRRFTICASSKRPDQLNSQVKREAATEGNQVTALKLLRRHRKAGKSDGLVFEEAAPYACSRRAEADCVPNEVEGQRAQQQGRLLGLPERQADRRDPHHAAAPNQRSNGVPE